MSSTFSPTLRLELIGDGDQSGIWGQTTNQNLGALVEQAITGVVNITLLDANYTMSNYNGVVDEARNAVIVLTGTLTQQRNLIAPLVEKTYSIKNTTTGGFGVQILGSSGTGVVIPNGQTIPVYCDGTNFYALVTGSATNFSVTGNLAVSGTSSLVGNTAVGGNLAVTGTSTFTGIPSGPTAPYGTNTTQLATTAFVQASVPAGVIVLWSGSIASIPTGWYLCNGLNSTPDLRDRFVVGAGSTYAVGATGGNATTTLLEANLPSHTHSISASGTTSTVNIDHTHSLSASGTTGTQSADHVHSGTTAATNIDHSHSGTTAIQSNGHTHTFSGTSSGQSNTHSHAISDPGHSHSIPYNNMLYNWPVGHDPNIRGDYGAVGANYVGSPVTNSATTGVSAGSADADHSHTYGGTTSDMSANHTHTITTAGMNSNTTHTHTITTGGVSADHTHNVTVTGTSGAMSANATHSHTVTVTGTSGATGSGTSFSNLPPYYALAYIMKA